MSKSTKEQFIARAKAWVESNPQVGKGVRLSAKSKAEAAAVLELGKSLGCKVSGTAKSLGISKYTAYIWMREASKGAGKPAKKAARKTRKKTDRTVSTAVKLESSRSEASVAVLELPGGVKITGLNVEQVKNLISWLMK